MSTTTFRLGRIIATRTALSALANTGELPGAFITRHANGERGELPRERNRRSNPLELPWLLGRREPTRTSAGNPI